MEEKKNDQERSFINNKNSNGAARSNNAAPSIPNSSSSFITYPAPPATAAPAKATKPSPPRDYKTRNIKVSVPQQWGDIKDDHSLEVIIKSTASPALTTEGRTLRASIARVAAKNARSPGKQASIWFNFLTVPRWNVPQTATFNKLFVEGAAPVFVEAVVPITGPTIIRRPKPVARNQLTLDMVHVGISASSIPPANPAPQFQQVNFSKASQDSALSGELRLRLVFPSVATAENAQRWINYAADKAKNIGVSITTVRSSLPLQCVEVAFDVTSMHQDIAQGIPVVKAVESALHRRGVATDCFIVLNEEAQCVAPIRPKDVQYKGITSIRYRPRVLLPLHSLTALEKHSDDFLIRTVALRMCSGCGPASFSHR